MTTLLLSETKTFMSHLLVKDTFDKLLLSEANIATFNTFSINGSINKAFFTHEELETFDNNEYSTWAVVKPFCYSLIKGNKVPTGMKYIFVMPTSLVDDLIAGSGSDIKLTDVNGLFLNIRYNDGKITIITGSSYKIFTMDKTLDKAFDSYIKQFLDNAGISFEEF